MEHQLATEVKADSLLRGTFYAAENAWHFLQDAVLLFQSGRYSNTLVLATYCLEDVGRASLCLQHRKKGDSVTVKSLRKEFRIHAFSLAQAKIPVSVGSSSFGEPPPPGSPQEAELFERLRLKREKLENDAPHRAKTRRFGALYVTPLDDGIHWNCPSDVSRDDADHWLGAAYVAYLRVRGEALAVASEEDLDEAFWGWRRQPKLPEPHWDI